MAQWQSKGAIGADLYAVDTTQEFTLGTIVTAEDTDSTELGSAEFMYVKGVASVEAGSVVNIDLAAATVGDHVLSLAVAGDKGPIGVAVSALVADTYGWVQVSGIATAKVAASFAAGNVVYLTATPGTVDDAVVAGDEIYTALSLSAIDTPTTGQAYIYISRPFVTDASN